MSSLRAVVGAGQSVLAGMQAWMLVLTSAAASGPETAAWVKEKKLHDKVEYATRQMS